MAGATRMFVLEESRMNLHRRWVGGPLVCRRCGESLWAGDSVVSIKGKPRKYYHRACWDKMFLDV